MTDNSAIVDVTNDKIVTSNTFALNDSVKYNNGGGVNIGGLTSGTSYFIRDVTATEFKLSATAGGSIIDLTANNEVTFDADNASATKSVTITDSTDTAVVDATNDKIIISNTFVNGEQVHIAMVEQILLVNKWNNIFYFCFKHRISIISFFRRRSY